MSITTSAVKYNVVPSEYILSGNMVHISTALPDTPIADRWITEPCFLPQRYELIGNEILDFEVRPDDIWVISYPKTGTTWTQEMVWMLCNDLDYKTATSVTLNERHHFIEFEALSGFSAEHVVRTVSPAKHAPSPRMLKSHLPIHLLPRQLWSVKPKIVYVARNPKDTAISYYHHLKNLQGCNATFEESMNAFRSDQLLYSPFHSHVLNFWKIRNKEFVHFVMYEDMKENMMVELIRAARFFGKSYSSVELRALEQHLSFDAMRINKFVNYDGAAERVRRRLGVELHNHEFK